MNGIVDYKMPTKFYVFDNNKMYSYNEELQDYYAQNSNLGSNVIFKEIIKTNLGHILEKWATAPIGDERFEHYLEYDIMQFMEWIKKPTISILNLNSQLPSTFQ